MLLVQNKFGSVRLFLGSIDYVEARLALTMFDFIQPREEEWKKIEFIFGIKELTVELHQHLLST